MPGREVLILTEAELRGLAALDLETIGVVEAAFTALARGGVENPPILSLEIPAHRGEVDVKTAYIPGVDQFAVKISPGFFDNPKRGLPSLNGLMTLFCAETGLLEAALLDNGWLTDLRTAAAGAVAAKHLAPARVRVAGALGAGAQARLQLQAAHLVRPFERALIWARDPAKAAAAAADVAATLGVAAEAAPDPATLVAACQLVVTTTPARAPLITADMLHPGLHITAMGSDQPGKTEIAPDALAAADRYVADLTAQCAALGELRGALRAGLMREADAVELGAVALGQAPGRASADALTIADLTGTGAQDTAIAAHLFAAARAAGVGARIAV